MSAATRLYVNGLPRDLLDDDLRARFTPFGAVSDLEVCREKENSPFFADGRTDELAPSVRGDRGGRGGRGGAGGRGKKKGRGGAGLPPSRPPPCRGYAFVTVAFPDDHALRRCLNAYNGTKWKGGTIHVHPAKPRFDERLRMEREGIHPGRPGMRAEVDDDEALGDDDDDDERQPLRPGDLLEIDGRVRNSVVTVAYATGATTHVVGEGSFPTLDASPSTPDWTPFPDDASNRTLRKLCQLPGLAPRKPPAETAAGGGRRRRRDDDDETEMILDDAEVVEVEEDGTAGDGDAGRDDWGRGGEPAGGGADRFDLPREFFNSDVAAKSAAKRAAGGDDDKAGGEGSKSKRRKKDTVEMRALAAFLGSDGDDGDETEGATGGETRPAAVPVPAKSRRGIVGTLQTRGDATGGAGGGRDPHGEGGVEVVGERFRRPWSRGDGDGDGDGRRSRQGLLRDAGRGSGEGLFPVQVLDAVCAPVQVLGGGGRGRRRGSRGRR